MIADDWRDDLFAYIGGTVKDHKAVVLKAGGVEDHIHLLAKFHPQFAIASTIKLLKSNSSKWINENSKTRSTFRWQPGYGAFSVSQSMTESVRQYIATQREHHRKRTFRDEYLAMLEKHQIKFDPRYVFEQELIS